MIFIITPERLMLMLSQKAKGQGKGQLNWYINSKDNNIHVYYSYLEVDYLCILPNDGKRIPIDILSYLGRSFEVLGVYEEKKEETIIPQLVGGMNPWLE